MLMNPDMDNFMQKFFQTSRLEEADVTSMEQLVRQYPYYAPLQYILAKKYRQVNNTQYKLQITKTAIFFSNPHWLNDLLLSDEIASYEDDLADTGVHMNEPVGDSLPTQSDVVPHIEHSEQKIDEELLIEPQEVIDENRAGNDFEPPQPIDEAEEDQVLTEQDESGSGEPVPDILPTQKDIPLHDQHSEQKTDEELLIEPQEVIDENRARDDFELTQPVVEADEDQFLTEQNETGYGTHIPSFNEGFAPGNSQAENNMGLAPNQEIIPAELQADIDIVQEIPESFPEGIHEDEAATEKQAGFSESGSDLPEQYEKGNDIVIADASVEEAVSVPDPGNLAQEEEQDSPASVGSGMDAGMSDIASGKPETGLPEGNLYGKLVKPGSSSAPDSGNLPLVPIEPLYAVDYFASQGIKLKDEDGKDKLSQKLRSFTEWLKTMKRIHPEKLEQEMDSQTSTVIQHIAEHSNELEDVVTEAMAEVYARQGLRNKAAEVYQKLSLLNPNKRAYFAARISKLNET
jgi:hypothetical protein